MNSVDPTRWKFKHIIIDEGQDFYEEHLEILSTIANLTDGCFYVFYDKNQLVQQRQSLDWVKSVECRLVLTANCRNTKSIAVTANKPIGIEKIKMRVDVPGSKPNLYLNALKKYYSIIEEPILKNGGTISEIGQDGVMAYWIYDKAVEEEKQKQKEEKYISPDFFIFSSLNSREEKS